MQTICQDVQDPKFEHHRQHTTHIHTTYNTQASTNTPHIQPPTHAHTANTCTGHTTHRRSTQTHNTYSRHKHIIHTYTLHIHIAYNTNTSHNIQHTTAQHTLGWILGIYDETPKQASSFQGYQINSQFSNMHPKLFLAFLSAHASMFLVRIQYLLRILSSLSVHMPIFYRRISLFAEQK